MEEQLDMRHSESPLHRTLAHGVAKRRVLSHNLGAPSGAPSPGNHRTVNPRVESMTLDLNGLSL